MLAGLEEPVLRYRVLVRMTETSLDTLLTQINAALTDRNALIRDRRKLLLKADCRETADAIGSEVTALVAEVETLKIQQKALKRGIIPEELVDKETPVKRP